METYHVELISIDDSDTSKDISVKTTVEANNYEDALKRAKTKIKKEKPVFNTMRVWSWHVEQRPLR